MKQECKLVLGVLSVGLLAFAQSGQSGNATGSANRLAGADQTFVMKAAEGGIAEVKLGTLAAQKATDPAVKSFGQQMVDDHSKANDELKSVASSRSWARTM